MTIEIIEEKAGRFGGTISLDFVAVRPAWDDQDETGRFGNKTLKTLNKAKTEQQDGCTLLGASSVLFCF